MKKIKSHGLLLCICLLFVFSCNKQQDTQLNSEELAGFESLKSELLDLNNSLPETNLSVDTKSLKWWHYLIIGAADAAGGFIPGGGVATAISASTLAWTIIDKERHPKEEKTKGLSSLTTNSINSKDIALNFVDGDGEVHNEVILSLYYQYGEGLFELPEVTLNSVISKKVTEFTGVKTTITKTQMGQIQDVVNAYFSSDTIEEFVDGLACTSGQRKEVKEIINILLDGYSKIDPIEDCGRYSKNVSKAINMSEIPIEAKETLNNFSSVANASSRLWNTQSLIK